MISCDPQVRVINAIRLWLEMAVDFKGVCACAFVLLIVTSPYIDNGTLQAELLQFITSVLTVDHPKHARQLRTSLLIIKVKIDHVIILVYHVIIRE